MNISIEAIILFVVSETIKDILHLNLIFLKGYLKTLWFYQSELSVGKNAVAEIGFLF